MATAPLSADLSVSLHEIDAPRRRHDEEDQDNCRAPTPPALGSAGAFSRCRTQHHSLEDAAAAADASLISLACLAEKGSALSSIMPASAFWCLPCDARMHATVSPSRIAIRSTRPARFRRTKSKIVDMIHGARLLVLDGGFTWASPLKMYWFSMYCLMSHHCLWYICLSLAKDRGGGGGGA